MKILIVLAAAAALSACGGGGNPVATVINPPPVQAQSGFSVASLNGTCALGFTSAHISPGTGLDEMDNGVGTVTLDGAGQVTGGSVTSYGTAGTCTFTLTGSAAVQASGAGSISFTLTRVPSNPPACGPGRSGAFTAELGVGGDGFTFAESDFAASGALVQGTAVKQQ